MSLGDSLGSKKRDLPFGVIKDCDFLGYPQENWRLIAGNKIIKLRGELSSKPCLISGYNMLQLD